MPAGFARPFLAHAGQAGPVEGPSLGHHDLNVDGNGADQVVYPIGGIVSGALRLSKFDKGANLNTPLDLLWTYNGSRTEFLIPKLVLSD